MGLSLKLSMILNDDPETVYRSLLNIYGRRGLRPLNSGEQDWDEAQLHAPSGGWTILSHGIGWWFEQRCEELREIGRYIGSSDFVRFRLRWRFLGL